MPPKQNAKPKSKRVSFKWTGEVHRSMAEYLRENYEEYKKSLSSQRKMAFLRKMKEKLGVSCTDQQFKNGFQNFVKKYEEVKKKLNASGFGVDPDKDATLNKHWIVKVCPYYELLDEVMGTRPNVSPPFVVSTDAHIFEAEVTKNEESDDFLRSSDVVNSNFVELDSDVENGDPLRIEDTNAAADPTPVNEPTLDKETTEYVRKTLGGMNSKKAEAAKSPLGVFAKIMEGKMEETVKVEREKLHLIASQHEDNKGFQTERNRIELLKVNSQNDLENKRFDLEVQKLAERRADRDHELTKLKLQQEFELKKLELQLQLQK